MDGGVSFNLNPAPLLGIRRVAFLREPSSPCRKNPRPVIPMVPVYSKDASAPLPLLAAGHEVLVRIRVQWSGAIDQDQPGDR
jgi:hypothetical protein